MKIVFILFSMFLSLLHAKDSYELGDGVQISSLPIYLGGYISTEYERTKSSDKYKVDDIALLSYGNYQHFSYMAELEYKNFYINKTKDNISFTQKDTSLYVERLYLDYTFNEHYMERVGKYLSPIGFWNLLPINVLRDTTSNPMSTNIIFPELTTGFYTSYTNIKDSELKIDIMLQHNEDIDNKYSNYRINKHYGVGISYEKENFTTKINFGYFNKLHRLIEEDYKENENEESDEYYTTVSNEEQDLYYMLFSAKYDSQNYQFMGEIGRQASPNGPVTNYALYLQGLYRITQKHTAIIRIESYDDEVTTVHDTSSIFAYTYRPAYPIAFKAEYQLHALKQYNKFFLSFSVLF
ncbi:hypothetical protein [Sulfurimonas sp.]